MPPAVMPSRGMEKRKSQLMALAPLATMIARMISTGSTTSSVASSRTAKAIFWVWRGFMVICVNGADTYRRHR